MTCSHSHHLHLPIKWSRTTRLKVVILLSGTIFLVEIVVGLLSHGLVLIADAFHVISDLFGYLVILYCMKLKEKDDKHFQQQTNSEQANLPIKTEYDNEKRPLKKRLSYGWQRAEIVSAFFNGSFLIALSVSIFLQSLDRFANPQIMHNPEQVVIVGAISLTLNITSALIFHEHPEHNTIIDNEQNINIESIHASHHHTRLDKGNAPQKKKMNLAAMGVLIHILGDTLNTIGVIIVGLISWFVKDPTKRYADPTFSMVIAASIFLTALPLTMNSSTILLQATPKHIQQECVLEDLMMIENVEQVHELHIWQIDQENIVASAHVIVGCDSKDQKEIVKEVRNCLHAWGIHSITLQVEHCPQQPEVVQIIEGEISNETLSSTTNSYSNISWQEKLLQKTNHNRFAHAGKTCLVDGSIDYQSISSDNRQSGSCEKNEDL